MAKYKYDAEQIDKEYEALHHDSNLVPGSASPKYKYDAAQIDKEYEQNQQSLVQATTYNASFENPDDAAERKRLADQLKQKANEDWSPNALDVKDAKRRVSLLDSTPVLENSPALSNRFLTQGFAARTIDDIPSLGKVESAATKLKNINTSIPIPFTDYGYDPVKSLKFGAGVIGHAASSIVEGYLGLQAAMNRAQASLISPFFGEDNLLSKMSEEQFRAAQFARQGAEASQEFAGAGEGAGYGKRMVFGAGSNVAQVLALGLPMAAEKAIATKATPAAEGLLGKLTAEFTKQNALAVAPMALGVAGQEATTAYEQGMGPWATLGYAGGQGLIEGITEMLPFGAFVRDVKMSAPIWKILRNQLVTENLSEQVATHTQDLLSWAMLPENADKTFGDYLTERPSAALDTFVQTSIATVFQTSVMKSLHDRAVRNMSDQQKAVHGEQAMNDVISAVQETKSHKRNPEDVKDLMDDIGAESVHIDARTAAQVLNQSQLQTLVSQEDLDTALAAQGDIVVPASQFAMAVASDESMRSIVEHVRVNPELPSAAEAREVEAKRQEMLKQQGEMSAESEKILTDAQTEKEFVDSASELETNLYDQIKATGQFLPEAAKAYSKSVQAFYVTQAKALKMKPMELYKLLPYNITTGSFEQNQAAFNQEEYIRKNVTARNEQLTAAAQKLERGEVTREEYEALVNSVKPVLPYQSVPMPEAEDTMRTALSSDKQDKLLAPRQLDEGTPVGLRLDIPAYTRHNAWVVSVHEQKPGTSQSSFQAGTVIGYDNVAAVTNATFGMPAKGALNIATGKTNKGTIAVIKGNWRKTTPEQAKQDADAALNDPSWIQVGMDPERHSYFYDRKTKQPVVAADEVIQIGPLVLAKNPTYAEKQDYLYQSSENATNEIDANQTNTTPAQDDAAPVEQTQVPTSVDDVAVLDNTLKIAKSQTWNRGRDLKLAIQNSVQQAAANASVDVSVPGPQTTEYLIRTGVKDALMALQQNSNAIGWYDLKTRQALAIMALVHPEIATDENSRFAFIWALAVTSNGLKVNKNFELAEKAYSQWKKKGKMPTNIKGGQAQKAINEGLGLFNSLSQAWGMDDLRKFMMTNFTVGEITSLNKDLSPGGEHADTNVRGAAILGPKIGNGFFSNLYGHFDALTMDRWLVRTWGRWTGTLIKLQPEQTAIATTRLNAAVAKIVSNAEETARLSEIVGVQITGDTDINALSEAVQKASMDPDLRSKMNETEDGEELRKAGNSLAKYLDGQKEAPSGPGERNYIRQIFSGMLNELRQMPEYAKLEMADLQAVLWYAEKRLYETAKEDPSELEETNGYSDEEAPDYANAAAAVARKKRVTQAAINNALQQEIDRGRTRNAGFEAAKDEANQKLQEQYEKTQGFTEQEKRLFRGAVAIWRSRSNRFGTDGLSWSYEGRDYGIDNSSGLLIAKKKKALNAKIIRSWKPGNKLANILRRNGINVPEVFELEPSAESAQRFADLITESKNKSGASGAAVEVYPADGYREMRLFVSEDGKAGVAVKQNGDIVSLFSNNGSGRTMLEIAIAAGGVKLDCFDTVLPKMYAAHGFVATSRTNWIEKYAPKGWDKSAFKKFNDGEPDVVYMVYDPKYYGQYRKADGELVEEYDQALALQTARLPSANKSGVLFQNAPVWKSVLLESVQTAKIEKAPGNDWLNILRKSAKADEIESTDLAEFLEDRSSVSKQEIVDYLNSNGVVVQETMLYEDVAQAANDILNRYGYQAEYNYGELEITDNNDDPVEMYDLDIPRDEKDALLEIEKAKFYGWSFGNKEYQELILSLPVKDLDIVEYHEKQNGKTVYYLMYPTGGPVESKGEIVLFSSKEEARRSSIYQSKSANVPSSRSHLETHWDKKNVLAHVRFSTKFVPELGDVFIVEEVQSNWGQEGREVGFQGNGLTVDEAVRLDTLESLSRELSPDESRILSELKKKEQSSSESLRNAPAWKLQEESQKLPSGPFVKDTKAWTSLAVKRMLRYAADHGFKRIAFINGNQAAERFNLRHQVEYLSYDTKKKKLRAWNDKRIEVLSREGVEPDDLSRIIGKETAKKLLAIEPVYGQHNLSGEQLEVGGEGMIGYYNQIVPQVVSKLVGKFGAKPYLADIGLPLHPARGGGAQQQMIVDISPEMRTELKNPQPLFQQTAGPRGGFDPSTLTTILTEKTDMSTFLHETGHFYLEAMFKLAGLPNATQQMKDDAQTVLDWFGVPNLETWNSMTLEDQRKYHEQWAYNHEIYLYEGKAPSLKLQSLFDKFSAWLRQVYKSIRTDLNAIYRQEHGEDLPILTGEVRQVMDRLMASNDQIEQAEEVRGMKGIFQTQQESGMDDEQWAEYQSLQQESHESSVSDLTKSTLRQMKWLSNARSKLLKAMQAKVNEVRKGVQAEVAKEVAAEPVYRAIRFLRTGQMEDENGNPIEVQAGNKLNKGMVQALYPEGALVAGPDMSKLRGMLSEDGLPPDMVAEIFEFTSGDDMIRAIAAAKPIKEAVSERTDDRMLKEHSELMDPEVQSRNIEQALHTEARARFVAVELRFLAKATQPVRVMLQAAKQAAQQIISGKKIKDIRPRDYSMAEARAAKKAEAHLKKGESQDAAREKQGQLLQGQLAAEAVSARNEVDAAVRSFKKFFAADKKIAARRDMDLVNAARSILSAFGLGPSGKSPFDFVDQLRAYNPDLYAELEPLMFKAAQGATNYKQLTMDEFRAMKDAVNALWFNARRDKQIMVEGQAVDLAAIITELNNRMVQIGIPETVAGERKAPTNKDRLVRTFNNTKAILRRVEHWADSIDGAEGPGAFTKFIWRPIKDALNAYRISRNDYVKRYSQMVEALDLPVGIIEAPELGYSFGHGNGGIGKAELIGAILHTGNESNIKKLLAGRGWGTISEDGILDTSRWDMFVARMIKEGHLTKEDFDFAQAVWDLNEEIKPMAQKAHHDMFGYYFKEVPNTPFSNQFDAYRGGYVPAKTDPFIVRDAQRQSKMEALESDFRNAMPSTGLGFTKGRVEYNRPLSLDVRQMTNHIDSVIRFSLVQPAIKDALKILRNKSFADNLSRLDPSAIEDMLIPWLNRAARQITSEVGKSAFMDAVWRGIRQRTGIAIMFGNLRNALQQLTGYFPAALKVKPKYLKDALASYISNTQSVTEEVAALSPFMQDRLNSQIFDIQENINDILLNPSKFEKLQKWTQQHGYFLQTAFQNQVDVVTWTATYNQTLAELGKDISDEKSRKEAVQRADAAVRLTQSSLSAEDLAAFEVGTPFTKSLTHFGGYLNMMANLNVTAFTKVMRDLGWRGNKGKLLYVYLLGIALPALVGDAIMRSLGAGWDDDDEDGYLDEFMSWFFGSQSKMITGMVPFAGQLTTATYGALTSQQYDDKISISPSITALESAGGTIKAGVNIVSDDKDLTGKNVRDVMTFLSITTGIPMTVLGRPVGYLVDVKRGAIQPTSSYDLARGVTTGVASKGSVQR